MPSLLEPVGLGEVDSEVYVHLLTHPGRSAADIATHVGLPASRVRKALSRLVSAGLVTRLVTTPVRFVSAPPDVAVDALVLRRQQQLEQLRAEARELRLRVDQNPAATGPNALVELIEGVEAVSHHLARIQMGAREEVLIVDSPPYLNGQIVQNNQELQALARGIRYRAVYHAPALEDPAHLRQMLECVAAGEEARALPSVRMKMLIVDGRLAMVPLSFSGADGAARILVHPSPLLDALVHCFESLWQRATPAGLRPPMAGPTAGGDDSQDQRLLSMLAAGLKDRTIARALGVTERTISRRISELLTDLNASTRFQAGLQAARRGLL